MIKYWNIIYRKTNLNDAKNLTVLLMIGIVCYHFKNWNNYYDPCGKLIHTGELRSDGEWQPEGCMMHKYDNKDTYACLDFLSNINAQNKFVFIGGDSIYLLFKYFQKHLEDVKNNPHSADIHYDLPSRNDHSVIKYVDSKSLIQLDFVPAARINDRVLKDIKYYLNCSTAAPTKLIIGFDAWNLLAKDFYDKTILYDNFRKDLSVMNATFEAKPHGCVILYKLHDRINPRTVPDKFKTIYNKDITKMNRLAFDAFKNTSTITLHSLMKLSNILRDEAVDGYKLSTKALWHSTQILFNMHCNLHMNHTDGTCCRPLHMPTDLQIIAYSFLISSVVLTCIATILISFVKLYWKVKKSNTFRYPVQMHPVIAVAKLFIIMLYFFFCDRTNMFSRENSHFHRYTFCILAGIVVFIGLKNIAHTPSTDILNGNQVEETKGWVILVILICNICGAEKFLFMKMHIKLFFSVFLFLEGYTHLADIWRSEQLGFIHFCRVMYKLNFFTIVLCYCMGNHYQTYYFVRLTSFWTCFIYAILLLPQRTTITTVRITNCQGLNMILKIILCLTVIKILHTSHSFFREVFSMFPWKKLFVIADNRGNSLENIENWWNECKLDRYTVCGGVIFAGCIYCGRATNILDDRLENLFRIRTTVLLTILSGIGISFFPLFAMLCDNEENCDEMFSYILFIPILGYIMLRNLHFELRHSYSVFFAWFGRISLELYLCSYHIWLASDGGGILLLIPSYPVINGIVSTFILVCVADEVYRIRKKLLPTLIPKNEYGIAITFFCFAVLLVPVFYKSDLDLKLLIYP